MLDFEWKPHRNLVFVLRLAGLAPLQVGKLCLFLKYACIIIISVRCQRFSTPQRTLLVYLITNLESKYDTAGSGFGICKLNERISFRLRAAKSDFRKSLLHLSSH